ncbi:Outer membrane scaffolding protein for murein synthesis, MipA/OmpV family [Alteromonadaceae bacterium Bs31]|nr:Outer membrane scaffolding protein for murein synthesis, MipA/OmpV family [Alteromonadaceae bacterium Bs31]
MLKLLSALLILFLSAASLAQARPKAELGVGMAAQYLRDYRGSSESQLQTLPFPIIVYRGDVIQADKDGIRGRFLAGNGWELNASAEAALNGGSPDNSKREGMPELNSAFELGPSLNFNLTGQDFEQGWSLRLPVRAVFALDFSSIEYIGVNFNPKFTFRKPEFWRGWDGKMDLGLLWATHEYHDYYYRVDEEFVTDSRAFYDAEGGFSGTYVKFSLKKRMGQWWFAWNLRYDYLGATVFEDSPLMETTNYFSTAAAVGWFFWASD